MVRGEREKSIQRSNVMNRWPKQKKKKKIIEKQTNKNPFPSTDITVLNSSLKR